MLIVLLYQAVIGHTNRTV